jgi:TetR/AcrR family transcriptional regulator, fatty acid metabolism regulator protein
MEALTPRLISTAERAIAQETDPVAKVDAALRTVLDTFSRHRRLSKILLIEAVGLGHGFEEKLMDVRAQFAAVIQKYLDQAVAEGAIAPIDTKTAAFAWLGAINEIVIRWVVTGDPERLEDIIPSLRALLLRSVGVNP